MRIRSFPSDNRRRQQWRRVGRRIGAADTGGWPRRRADDSPIVSNRVRYTLTRLDGGWGIQARFGVDSFEPDGDQQALAEPAIQSAFLRQAARQAGDREGWLSCFHYPLTAVVAPGCVEVLADPDQLRAQTRIWEGEAQSDRLQVIAAGTTGALLALHPEGRSGEGRGAALVARREGTWKTLAITLLA